MNSLILARFAVFVTILAVTLLAQAPGAGSLSGSVAGDDGKLLVAVVTLNGVPPLHAFGRATSSANGAFTVSNLPAGSYHICADVKGGGYLNPCAWEPVLSTVQVTGGQALTGYRLIARKGALLQVRVNDPGGVLSAASAAPAATATAAAKPAPRVMLGVFTARGLFQPLAVIAQDAGGTSHQGTVPQNAPASLHISGQGVQITDDKGTTVNAAGSSRVVPPGGATPPTITFTVTAPPK